MGDVISLSQPSAAIHHRRCNTVEELGRVGTLAVRIVASNDNPGLLQLVVMGSAAGSEVLASADNEPDYAAALRAIGQRVLHVGEREVSRTCLWRRATARAFWAKWSAT
jgi:homospermidine synthase